MQPPEHSLSARPHRDDAETAVAGGRAGGGVGVQQDTETVARPEVGEEITTWERWH